LYSSIQRAIDAREGAFLNELQEFQELNPRFKFIPTITHPDRVPHDWRGELGHITEPMLDRWLPASEAPIFYIAGPPGMVDGMRQMLCDALVSDDDIRAEEFAGYGVFRISRPNNIKRKSRSAGCDVAARRS
jgi:NAD(P)H-flavin reductase